MKTSNKPNLVIVAFPPTEVIESINYLKGNYLNQKSSNNLSFPIKLYNFPHITLKRKFTLNSKVTEKQICNLIEQLIKNFPDFGLETGKIQLLKKPNKNTVYLEIKNSPKLIQLNGKIAKALKPITTTFEPKLDINFIPHITIFWEISGKKLKLAEKIFQEKIPILKFKVAKLYLLKSSTKFEGKRELIKFFSLIKLHNSYP